MPNFLPHIYLTKQQNNGGTPVDVDTDTLKLRICKAAYVPAPDAHVFMSSVTNEVIGTGYTAGGPTLASVTFTADGSDMVLDAADISIPQNAGGFSDGRVGVLYKSTGNDATSPILATAVAAANFGNVSSPLTIRFAATGIVRWKRNAS